MADGQYGTVRDLLSAPIDQQGLLRALFLYNAALEVRKSIHDDSYDDQKAQQQRNPRFGD